MHPTSYRFLPLLAALALSPAFAGSAVTGKPPSRVAAPTLAAVVSDMTAGCVQGPSTLLLLAAAKTGAMPPQVTGAGSWSALQDVGGGVSMRAAQVAAGAAVGGAPLHTLRLLHADETDLSLLVLVTPAASTQAKEAFGARSRLVGDGSHTNEVVFMPAPEGGTAATCAFE